VPAWRLVVWIGSLLILTAMTCAFTTVKPKNGDIDVCVKAMKLWNYYEGQASGSSIEGGRAQIGAPYKHSYYALSDW
jgi:hypothetical protein